MQLCNGDDLGVSQQTVSRVISETLDALCAQPILKRFIKFPPIQQLQQKKEQFWEVAGFPEVVGAIDGTHIRIVKLSEFEVEYVNRKRYHSINVQVVFYAKYNIIDLEAKWPGSVHDSRILNESGLKRMFETGAVPAGCHLLGVSGYGSKTWLLTPYLRPQLGYQSNYNRNIQLLFEDDPGHDQPPAEDNIQMAANDDDDDQVEPPPFPFVHQVECFSLLLRIDRDSGGRACGCLNSGVICRKEVKPFAVTAAANASPSQPLASSSSSPKHTLRK
ncbi:hypothetical protein Pcinc_001289 [Petrolisthes cinctipes]|uniref:DDE Tnp4 domain-containing protein n=1 Tax=Petrolisthes cinctipes TaxID=88211 RepID=A0AAE1L3G9_PETCI|nr:hypothetical protein Pcinc_001289 [Petrolisthes cinctipes]